MRIADDRVIAAALLSQLRQCRALCWRMYWNTLPTYNGHITLPVTVLHKHTHTYEIDVWQSSGVLLYSKNAQRDRGESEREWIAAA